MVSCKVPCKGRAFGAHTRTTQGRVLRTSVSRRAGIVDSLDYPKPIVVEVEGLGLGRDSELGVLFIPELFTRES